MRSLVNAFGRDGRSGSLRLQHRTNFNGCSPIASARKRDVTDRDNNIHVQVRPACYNGRRQFHAKTQDEESAEERQGRDRTAVFRTCSILRNNDGDEDHQEPKAMATAIHAVYEHGVFRPVQPVNLPDRCEVEVEIRPL